MKRGLICFLGFGLIFFFCACVKPTYKPCSVEIISPARGSVITTGTTSMVVQGVVHNGDSKPLALTAAGQSVAFDKSTGAFTCEVPIDSGIIYNTVEFVVKDRRLVTNVERVSYPVGAALTPGPGVVGNAVRAHLDQRMIDMIAAELNTALNDLRKPLVYGPPNELMQMFGIDACVMDMIPNPAVDAYPLGDIIVDPNIKAKKSENFDLVKGQINLGRITLSPVISDGDRILADLTITAEDGVGLGGDMASLYVQGCHQTVLAQYHLSMSSLDPITIKGIELKLNSSSDGAVIARLDMANAVLTHGTLSIQYGILDIKSKFLSFIINKLLNEYIISQLGSMEFEVFNLDSLPLDLAGLTMNVWAPEGSLFRTQGNEANIDLGLSMVCLENPLNPGLTTFLSTPSMGLPELRNEGEENLTVAVDDDFANEALFSIIQNGFMVDQDFSSELGGLLSGITDKPVSLFVTVPNPPVFDFSGKEMKLLGESTTLGRISIRDVEMKVRYNDDPTKSIAARIILDADALLKWNIREDGTLGVTIDKDKTDSRMTVCYTNIVNAKFVPEIGKVVVNDLLEVVLDMMFSFEIPVFDLGGKTLSISIIGTEAKDNYLMAKVKISLN